jgi:hypothetical protein
MGALSGRLAGASHASRAPTFWYIGAELKRRSVGATPSLAPVTGRAIVTGNSYSSAEEFNGAGPTLTISSELVIKLD